MKGLSAILGILLVLTAQAAGSAELPDFGGAADTVLSRSAEERLGRSVLLQLRNAGVILDDPMLAEYVTHLGSTIASHASDGDFKFRFFVIDDPLINAFAMPGGHIGINTGLILASENESELAGVVAHEVAHVTQRHIARSIYDNQRSSILTIASLIAAALLGATTDASGEAVQGVVAAGRAAAIQRQINFTRSNEQEADRIGIHILSDAGYNPEGMASFFETLSRRSSRASMEIPEMLRTHPMGTSRIAEARSRIRQLPAGDHEDSIGYRLAKARLLVLTQPSGDAALSRLSSKADSRLPEDRYAQALAYMRVTRYDTAEALFRELVSDYPGVMAYRTGHAEALMAAGSTNQAMGVYESATRVSPRNVPLTISYAEALIASGRPEAAHELLLDLLNNVQPTPPQIQLIARAANAEGDMANAHNYMAEYHISVGDYRLAVNQLRMALESPDANEVDRARFADKLRRLREAIPEEELRDTRR